MWQQAKELEQLNIKVIVIAFEPLRSINFPVSDGALSFSYCVDEKRELYRYYGILQAGFWDIWGPRTWITYLSLLLKGRKILHSQSDIHQRGGDVLVDPNGMVRYHHIGIGPGDRPDPALILKQVEQCS